MVGINRTGTRLRVSCLALAAATCPALAGPQVLYPTIALAAAGPTSAAASGQGQLQTFGIKPSRATYPSPADTRSRFDYAATPGAVQPDFVAITNSATTPVHLSLYASDGFNTASDGFDLLAASRKAVDVGAWITLKTNALEVPAGATVVVPFELRVPAQVQPGDHIGGIVASLRTSQVDKKGDRVAIDHRVGTRVYLRVQGPLDPRLALANIKTSWKNSWWNPFATGRLVVTYTVRDTGNVRLGAHQSVSSSGWYGAAQSASVPDIAELLPENAHEQRVVLSGVVPAFRQAVTLRVTPFSLPGDTDGRVSDVVRTLHVWVVPWPLLTLILLTVTAAVLAWRRRRRKPSIPAPAGQAGSAKVVGVER